MSFKSSSTVLSLPDHNILNLIFRVSDQPKRSEGRNGATYRLNFKGKLRHQGILNLIYYGLANKEQLTAFFILFFFSFLKLNSLKL